MGDIEWTGASTVLWKAQESQRSCLKTSKFYGFLLDWFMDDLCVKQPVSLLGF